MNCRLGLVGRTGFVGGALLRRRSFVSTYNSRDIDTIRGQYFDVLICAGAPATMWQANNDPRADAANLENLIDAISTAKVGTLVLISTVAVFDDMGAGYSESNARYETGKAYGRNRRTLELNALSRFDDIRIVRLPALFGKGLKKNFIFYLINPAPSFLNKAKYDEAMASMAEAERQCIARAYVFEADLGMWRLKRDEIAGTALAGEVERALARVGILSRNFTNAQSRYQYYNIDRLADDIDRCIERDIDVLNICSEPMSAAAIHQELTGEPFDNDAAPIVSEDVRSDHAGLFGANAPYLYGASETLEDLRSFYSAERVQ